MTQINFESQLASAKRIAAAQLLFQPVSQGMTADVRVAAAMLREVVGKDDVYLLAHAAASRSEEANMRNFVLSGEIGEAFDAMQQPAVGNRPPTDMQAKKLDDALTALRKKSAEYERSLAERPGPIDAAKAQSGYFMAALLMSEAMSDLSRKGVDVSACVGAISEEGLMARHDLIRYPAFGAEPKPVAAKKATRGMGV